MKRILKIRVKDSSLRPGDYAEVLKDIKGAFDWAGMNAGDECRLIAPLDFGDWEVRELDSQFSEGFYYIVNKKDLKKIERR